MMGVALDVARPGRYWVRSYTREQWARLAEHPAAYQGDDGLIYSVQPADLDLPPS
jgi:hypothetical protein